MKPIKEKKKKGEKKLKDLQEAIAGLGEIRRFATNLKHIKEKKIKGEKVKETIKTIPSVNIRSTYYENKKTGEFLGVKHEWQDVVGEWHLL